MSHTILGIESSCDETSSAIIRDGEVASLVIASQAEHHAWGGVVPEIASRAHLKSIAPIVREALANAGAELADIDAIAVTTEPGLIGSLLVGLNVAKGMAVALGKPLIDVHHIEAHLLSVMIDKRDITFPYLGLVVSGGHTLLYDVADVGSYTLIGATRDDAAGEAFDKGAKLLGLGYPGGPAIDRHAREGDRSVHDFPRALLHDAGDDFSFSGLKTSLKYYLRDHHPNDTPTGKELNDLCASYQEAIVDVLVAKTLRAAKRLGRNAVAVVGGVASNSRLRERMQEEAEKEGVELYTVKPIYSTDNAAMIGLVGWLRFERNALAGLDVVARSATIRSPRGKAGRHAVESTMNVEPLAGGEEA